VALNSTPATVVDGGISSAALWNTEVRDAFVGIQAAWTAYTPTLTNLTVGNGVFDAGFTRFGKTVLGRVAFTWGTTTSASGTLRISLPVTPRTAGANLVLPIGQAFLFDTSAATRVRRAVTLDGVNLTAALADDSWTLVTNTVPWTWAVGDTWAFEMKYEAA